MKYAQQEHDTKKFYDEVCKLIIQHNKENLYKAKITIDEQGGKDFRDNLSTYLKRGLNADGIKRIKKV
jgi:hypothetical protein